jgi:hypothetical protein
MAARDQSGGGWGLLVGAGILLVQLCVIPGLFGFVLLTAAFALPLVVLALPIAIVASAVAGVRAALRRLPSRT